MKKRLSIILLVICVLAMMAACSDSAQQPPATDSTASDVPSDTTPPTQDTTPPQSGGVGVTDYDINSFYDLNKNENAELSHAQESGYANLELDYRSLQSLNVKNLKTATAYYPRVKQMPDGNYILFYQTGEHGDTVYYTRSSDLVSWDTPTKLFVQDDDKGLKYATCDAVVLDNGEILAVCSYRTGSTYDVTPELNGIVMKKSGDNGSTWSDEKKIYVGTTWEPYPMQLSSGEVQVYFTNTTCYYRNEVADASTGTAMVRSKDRGESWTGDLSVPYSAQIVSQTPTRVSAGQQLYSDQMPVGIEMLGSGKIMLALETRMDKNGTYRISFSYSGDNWAVPLDKNASGPSEKLSKEFRGAAPYLRQFVSGEIMCLFTRSNNFTYEMFASDGKKHTAGEYMPFDGISGSYWGSIEILDTHTVLGIGETFKKVTVTRTENTLDYGKLNLNHSIKTGKMTPAIDGDAADWKSNDEALFVGSESQAQASVRCSYDDDNIYFLVERLDYYLDTKGDEVGLFFADASDSGYYKVVVDGEGVVSFNYFDGKKFTKLDASGITSQVILCGTVGNDSDSDLGYSVELSVPRSKLSSINGEMRFYMNLANSDKGVKCESDILAGMDILDKDTWISVKFN